MNGSFYRRCGVLTLAAAAGVGAWKFLPGSEVDRVAFQTVARGFANPPLFISGNGSAERPWSLRVLAGERKSSPKHAPTVVALQDDPKGFFQSSPPAPVDMAVIFSNLLRLGKTQAACAAMLNWEAPDPIGLGALEKVLTRFDCLVMAAPLTRGAVPGVMPPPFRRGSVPESTVHGDLANLPLVNRIPIPALVLGGENALGGFSRLESEAPGKSIHLLARWEDRIVFSFPLLTVLQRLKTPLDQVEIRLGECIRLGPNGAVIRIDPYGRLDQPVQNQPAFATVSAESLIDADAKIFPATAPDPVILRDDQSAAEPSTRDFSNSLSGIITTLASDGALTEPQSFPRLSAGIELGCLALLLCIIGRLTSVSNDLRSLGGIVIGGVILSAQWLALGIFSIWLPGLAMITILLSALALAYRRPQQIPNIPEPIRPPEPTPEPEATKAPAKKTAAKKVASAKRTTRSK